MEALGEWDHGLSDPLATPVDDSDPKVHMSPNTIKVAIINAERAVDGAVRNMIKKSADALKIDSHTKEELSSHSEEEVNGCKMCVSEVIHKDSFVAPS